MKLKKLLKTYNNADSYYHLTVFNGENALAEVEIENNDFSIIDEILNMKVFDWWDRYYLNWMQLTVRVE